MTEYQHPIGAVVEVDLDLSQPGHDDDIEINLSGRCRLYVVGHLQDSDGGPQYVVSDLPVLYPTDQSLTFDAQPLLMYRRLATVLESGLLGEQLRPIGKSRTLVPLERWLEQLS